MDAPSLAAFLAGPGSAIVFEVGYAGPGPFEQGHIPGAAWLDIGVLETAPLFNMVDDAALLAWLNGEGIRHDSVVILYGRSNSLAAARAALFLLYAGVRDVRLLDGGLPAWHAAGLPCVAGPGAAAGEACDFGAPFPGRPGLLCGLDDISAHQRCGSATLASIRTRSEFDGRTSGYCYIAARGEIPGARWGRAGCEGDVHSMSNYQLADGRMRPAGEIAAMWAASGIEPDARTVFYCGTGWRASLAFFYAWLMGWERISVYDGGWYEYAQSGLSIARGAHRSAVAAGSELAA